jgi:hypothetical protein
MTEQEGAAGLWVALDVCQARLRQDILRSRYRNLEGVIP